MELDKIKQRYKLWTENEYFDQKTRQELLSINDPKEIADRFYTDLEFGTGGMRGILRAGTNRMNRYVVRKITQGLADSILEYGEKACQRGVIIAFDSRRFSEEFALETALVLAENGIKAYLFDSLRPTPELSYAVRYLKTIAGVNITASHNPKEYNGYKVYWEDGGQIPPEKAKQIASRIDERISWEVAVCPEAEAKEKGLLVRIGEEVDQAYTQEIKKQLLFPQLTHLQGEKLKIVFTPLHGTGGKPVARILTEIGFSSLFIVPEQEQPDTEFSTVKSPNPEDPAAFTLALEYAAKQNATIVLGTDPDADRLGLYARERNGEYRCFNGNQIGVLLEYYVLSQKKKLGMLKNNSIVVKTVATTDLGDAVAELFGVKVKNVLVGFKYIGEQIKDMEENGWGTYEFGFEESFGYLAGTHARDKDAVEASALLAEAALYYKEIENKTLSEVLKEINELCGYYQDGLVSVSLQGQEGKERISRIMEFLRSEKITQIAGYPLKCIEDYSLCKRYSTAENKEEIIDLPESNILRFSFCRGGFVMARPSGTEPKIKFYFCVREECSDQLPDTMNKVKSDFLGRIQSLLDSAQ